MRHGRTGAGARQQKQLLDEALAAGDVVAHRLGGPAPLLGRRVRAIQARVDLRSDDAEGRSKLMRGVSGEGALGLDRCLNPLEHPVERSSQLGQLVVRAVGREAAAEVLLSDALCGQGDVANGPQSPRGQHAPDAQRDDAHHGEQCEEVQCDLAAVGGQGAALGRDGGTPLRALLARKRDPSRRARWEHACAALGEPLLDLRGDGAVVARRCARHDQVRAAEQHCATDQQHRRIPDGEA